MHTKQQEKQLEPNEQTRGSGCVGGWLADATPTYQVCIKYYCTEPIQETRVMLSAIIDTEPLTKESCRQSAIQPLFRYNTNSS
mmetsp:Transcript_2743/g.5915  ORF Transcript_2743/g.5915 Transcript_2743/m.5915 type:complete len:83 (-) Transcript_2743:45-293(-)